MDRQYLVPIIIAAFLLLALAGGAWYFIYKILHPSFETSPVTQSSTETPPTQNQESAPSTTTLATPRAATIGETRFSPPYPVSWQGYNKTNISLTAVSLTRITEAAKENYILNLNLKIETANGVFCADSFADYSLRRLIDEEGHLAPPDAVPAKCLGANSTGDEIVGFIIPTLDQEFNFQIFDSGGQLQTFFTVKIAGGQLQVEPALRQG